MRQAGIFLITIGKRFTLKERLLMAMSWFPKGTITATLGGVIL